METGIQLGVDSALDQVLERLRAQKHVWVVGAVGTGKRTLGVKLKDILGDRATFVEPVQREEADSAIGAFYQLTRDAREKTRAALWQDWSSMFEAALSLDDQLDGEWTFVVNVPSSWYTEAEQGSTDWDQASLRRCRDLMAGLARTRHRVVWITNRQALPTSLPFPEQAPISLSKPKNASALLRTVEWGAYQKAAHALIPFLENEEALSPIAVRLAVGATALGRPAERAAAELVGKPLTTAVQSLLDNLVDGLTGPQHSASRLAISRFLLARGAIRKADLLEQTSVPEEHAPLLTECIAYGDGESRITPSVRRHLASRPHFRLSVDEESEAHTRWSNYYATLDGEASITSTSGGRTWAWLEKMHHLLNSSESVDLSCLPSREFFWAHGRHLSIARKAHARAAEVYRQCVEKFDDDDYAHHYYAFNLERAGKARDVAEQEYQRAIELRPEHPWWNGRLVTFLIHQGRVRAARRAWRDALDHVDPDGDRTLESPELVEQLHRWVAQAWLDAGHVAEALEVIRGIPEAVYARSPRLNDLRQRVFAAAESDALGFSVYPDFVKVEHRWEKPAVLASHDLKHWWPGRILEADRDAVLIGYARRDADTLSSFTTRLSRNEWLKQNLGDPNRARGYLELGEYADGSKVIRMRDDRELDEALAEPNIPDPHSFAYLDRWRS